MAYRLSGSKHRHWHLWLAAIDVRRFSIVVLVRNRRKLLLWIAIFLLACAMAFVLSRSTWQATDGSNSYEIDEGQHLLHVTAKQGNMDERTPYKYRILSGRILSGKFSLQLDCFGRRTGCRLDGVKTGKDFRASLHTDQFEVKNLSFRETSGWETLFETARGS